jgi:hypothetical protein
VDLLDLGWILGGSCVDLGWILCASSVHLVNYQVPRDGREADHRAAPGGGRDDQGGRGEEVQP